MNVNKTLAPHCEIHVLAKRLVSTLNDKQHNSSVQRSSLYWEISWQLMWMTHWKTKTRYRLFLRHNRMYKTSSQFVICQSYWCFL